MKWYASLCSLFLLMAGIANAGFSIFQAGSGPPAAQFCAPGFTCDANGWTTFVVGDGSNGSFCEGWACTPSAGTSGTRIIYVSSSLGSDAGCPSCTNAGTFAAPLANPDTARQFLRDGSPDWVLLRCGDTWTNHSPTVLSPGHGVSGLNQGHPQLWSSYDSSAAHNPPVPDPYTCSARPSMNLDSGAVFPGLVSFQSGSSIHDVAIVGLKAYGWKRNPNDVNYSAAESKSGVVCINASISGSITNMLLEDNWCGSSTEGFDISAGGTVGSYFPNQISNVFVRRNQIINPFTPNNNNVSGMIFGGVSNGPTGYVMYENTIDKAGWLCLAGNTPCTINGNSGISWAYASGFSHDLYLTGTQINGDPNPNNQSTPPGVRGNIIANDGSASAVRLALVATDNLWFHNATAFGMLEPAVFANSIVWNVFLNGADTGPCCTKNGFQFSERYINEAVTQGSSTVSNNLVIHGVEVPSSFGIYVGGGYQNQTVTGNIIFNWNTANILATISNVTNAIYSYGVTNGGTSYTDLSTPIISAASSNTAFTIGSSFTAKIDNGSGAAGFIMTVSAVNNSPPAQGPIAVNSVITVPGGTNVVVLSQTGGTTGGIGTYSVTGPTGGQLVASEAMTGQSVSWPGDAQNYIILKVTNAANIALYGTIYLNGTCGLTGAYQATGLDQNVGSPLVPQYVIVYAANSYSAGPCGTLGTYYYPWYQVSLTGGTGSGAQADLISVGGVIKYAYLFGSDNQWVGEPDNSAGSGYVVGDVLSATPGTACRNTTSGPFTDSHCVGGWSFNGSTATGSGLQITVTNPGGVAINSVASPGCNLATNNVVDPTGANGCTFTDPGRSLGSLYATRGGATANATFTGVVASGVLTTSGQTGTLNLGDAIKWSGQTKQDYIKSFKTVSSLNAYFSINPTTVGPTAGATYTNSGFTYTVSVPTPATSGTSLFTTGNGVPATSSGTLTKASGTGDAIITFNAVTLSNGGAGTYNLTNLNPTVSSGPMSSYAAQQWINLADQQSKQTWDSTLTACYANQYLFAGFGVTDPCVP